MKRILAIRLPNWPVQHLISVRPELKRRAVILYRGGRRGQCVVCCCPLAWQLGVRPAMSVSEAAALVQSSRGRAAATARSTSAHSTPAQLHLQLQDPVADREALRQLAHVCQRFSPLVGMEEAEQPETLLLDVTGLEGLFGGERALVRQVVQELVQRQFAIDGGLGQTIGAAWALAHYGVSLMASAIADGDAAGQSSADRTLVLQSHPLRMYDLPCFDHLRSRIPVAALRLPQSTVQLLQRLGIEHLGHLHMLPRAGLSSRFGPLLLKRLDQAAGRVEEVIRPSHPPTDFTATWSLEYPTQQRHELDQILRHLIHRLTLLLSRQGVGALHLVCRLQLQSGPPLVRQVGLFQPSSRPQHLYELLQSSLERARLPSPVTEVCLQVTRQGAFIAQQLELFGEHRSAGSVSSCGGLAILIDRLTARLGHRAVTRPRLRQDAQPELAYELEANFGARATANQSPRSRSPGQHPLDRPCCLLSRPVPIRVTAVIPHQSPVRFWLAGRAYHVSQHFGPERIETGWHRRRGVRRDYYQVETTAGERFWLFRTLDQNQWFLHGKFS